MHVLVMCCALLILLTCTWVGNYKRWGTRSRRLAPLQQQPSP
jgi:hypothetical protein